MDGGTVATVFLITTIAFLVAWLWTPGLIGGLRRARLVKQIRTAQEAPVLHALHKKKEGTPTMGGIVVWATVTAMALIFFALSRLTDVPLFDRLDFLSRRQTLLPLGALVASAFVGILDDYCNVRRIGGGSGGLRARHRLLIYAAIAAVGAWWFFVKLEWVVFRVPFFDTFTVGPWIIPIFMLVIIATSFSVNEIDGLDGLAGGTLLAAFAAYGAIAFMQGKPDLAALCGAIVGALIAFLWYNINPAQIFMGDTGAMSLGVTLGVIAMLTQSVLFLPVVGIMLVVTSLSVILQIGARAFARRKLLRSSPLHHHLEAVGWTEPQIVMRYWMISGVAAVVGVILAIFDRI